MRAGSQSRDWTSLRSSVEARDLGNRVGVLAVPLAVGERDAGHRLATIAAATRRAKLLQQPAMVQAAVGAFAATPVARHLMAHQRWVNVFSTNLVGPPLPAHALGVRILDIVPIVQVAGNVTLAFCALSYSGGLVLAVTADATACPDIDVLMAGMERTWHELARGRRDALTGSAGRTARGASGTGA